MYEVHADAEISFCNSVQSCFQAVRKPLGKKKNSIVVEKTYNISCIQKVG